MTILPKDLQDQSRWDSDVYDRWRDTFEKHGLAEPMKAWRALTRRDD